MSVTELVDVSQSKDFLKLLFSDTKGLIEVREITKGRSTRRLFLDGPEQLEHYSPSPNANVFVGVFTRKKRIGKKEACHSTKCLWMDYDGLSLKQVQENIASAGLPDPSIWVNSGHGIHTYWLLDKPCARDITPILKSIVDLTNGDPMVANVAHPMRLPGTINVKREPVPCRIIRTNGIHYSLQSIAQIVGVNLNSLVELNKSVTEKVDIPELKDSNMACIRMIAKGVNKGQRNFALGKLTALLKLHGHSKTETLDLITRWNKNNNPPKPYAELRNEFERLWEGCYKFLGCSFSNSRLDSINEQLCSTSECEYHIQQEIQIIDHDEQTVVDNEIFKDTEYPIVKGLELAIYSIVSQEKDIKRDHLMELLKRNKTDKTFPQSINRLKSLGYIEVVKSGDKNAQTIRLKDKSNYGRGYTLINNLLWRIYVSEEKISDNAYKLLVLLKWFSYGKKIVFPTISKLALKMGVSERTITRVLADLEKELLLKRDYKPLQNGATKMYIRLKY